MPGKQLQTNHRTIISFAQKAKYTHVIPFVFVVVRVFVCGAGIRSSVYLVEELAVH